MIGHKASRKAPLKKDQGTSAGYIGVQQSGVGGWLQAGTQCEAREAEHRAAQRGHRNKGGNKELGVQSSGTEVCEKAGAHIKLCHYVKRSQL